MSKEISRYASANVLIIKTTAMVLEEYYKEEKKGNFQYKHSEMPEVKDLINQYRIIEKNQFKDFIKMSNWLEDVAVLIPSLWD